MLVALTHNWARQALAPENESLVESEGGSVWRLCSHLLPHSSAFKGLWDYVGPFWIIQDNIEYLYLKVSLLAVFILSASLIPLHYVT